MTTRAKGAKRNSERFSSVPGTRLPRSAFDRSYSHKSTFDAGLLIPLHIDEVLPGDTIHFTPSFFARMTTPIKPYMDGIHLDWQVFHCPMRLLWENFTKLMGERISPGDHNDYTIPQMVAPATVGHLVGSLSDYLTLPTDVPDYTHSSMFHRCYALIYQRWYRDANLQDQIEGEAGDGPDLHTDFPIYRRGKRKDYFSGALPFAQRGDPVQFPITGTAPVVTDGTTPTWHTDNSTTLPFTHLSVGGVFHSSGADSDGDFEYGNTGLMADLTTSTLATINDMRVAISLQHLLERDARGGGRYRETLMAHWGVQSDDIRLYRPEVLLTGSTPVNPDPVHATLTTSPGEDGSQLGDLAAVATAAAVGRGFVKTFQEHGIIMLIASVRADLTYQQGLNRMFSRLTRVDHYTPDLSMLGEQAVLSREIYTDGTGDPDATPPTGDWSTWGFQPRYEEYRHRHSVVTGELRSTFSSSLDVWHLALDFASRPVLNDAFIQENPPIDRIVSINSTEAPHFICDSFFKIRHVRAMPQYSIPGLTRF